MSAYTDPEMGIGFCFVNIYEIYVKSKRKDDDLSETRGVREDTHIPKDLPIIAFRRVLPRNKNKTI